MPDSQEERDELIVLRVMDRSTRRMVTSDHIVDDTEPGGFVPWVAAAGRAGAKARVDAALDRMLAKGDVSSIGGEAKFEDVVAGTTADLACVVITEQGRRRIVI